MLSDSLQEVLKRAFAEEAKRLLLNFEEELDALDKAENGAQRREHFGNLRRTAHTLKGASRSVEFAEVESLSLVLEKKFKSLATESDEPFLSQPSLDVLGQAVGFLDKTVNSLLEDSNAVVPGQELMQLMTQVEELELESAPESSGPKLPDSERDRIRFLIKMLKKTTSGEPMGSAFKKAFQILLSLNKIAQDNQLKNITHLTEVLEQKFRVLSTGKTPQEWPTFSLALELLAKFGKKPATFQSDLISDAIAELSEEDGAEVKQEQISDAFLEETNAHLEELRSLLNEASVKGKLDKKRLKVCMMSLTGATRVVDLPAAETISRSLNFALTKYAEAGRAPAALLTRAAEAVELLAQETKAFAEGSPGMPSWKAMHIVERLDSAVDEIETLGVEEEKAAPTPTPAPVSAAEKPPAKDKVEKKAEPEPVPEEPAPAPAPPAPPPAPAPPSTELKQKWATEALEATAPLEGLIRFVTRQTAALSKASKGLSVWADDNDKFAALVAKLPDGPAKKAAESFVQKQKQRLQSLTALLQRDEFQESDSKNLLRRNREVREKSAGAFLVGQNELTSKLSGLLQGDKLSFSCGEFEWDQRYWNQSNLGAVSNSVVAFIKQQASKKDEAITVKAACSNDSGFVLQFGYEGQNAAETPSSAYALRHQAKALFGKLTLPQKDEPLKVTLELPRFLASPRAVFFTASDTRYCLPTTSVWGVERLKEAIGEEKTLNFQGIDFTVHRMAPSAAEQVAVCVEKADGQRLALIADGVFSEEPLTMVELNTEESAEHSPQAYFQGGKTATLLDLEDGDLPTPSADEAASEPAEVTVVVAQTYAAARSILARAFRRAGYSVSDVPDGQAALEALEESKSAKKFLVADFHLNDMHGETLCETAKGDPNLGSLKCFVLAEPGEEHSGSKAVDEYLDKGTFDLDRLKSLIS